MYQIRLRRPAQRQQRQSHDCGCGGHCGDCGGSQLGSIAPPRDIVMVDGEGDSGGTRNVGMDYFDDGNTLWPPSPPPECFWGTPYLGTDGQWHCPDDPNDPSGPVNCLVAKGDPRCLVVNASPKPPLSGGPRPPIIVVDPPPTRTDPTSTTGTSDDEIFGVPKNYLWIGGAVAAGLVALAYFSDAGPAAPAAPKLGGLTQ